MTRKQAEQIARRITDAAAKAAPVGVYWTSQEVTLSESDTNAIVGNHAENGALIVGCLPIGWRLRRRGITGGRFIVSRLPLFPRSDR